MRKLLVVVFTILCLSGQIKAEEEIKTCFSPYDDCIVAVAKEVNKSVKTLDLALYSLTHDDITELIIDAHNAGVKVRLIIDKTQAGNRYADDEKLEAAGIDVIRMRSSKGGLMHHKFAIVDGKRLFTGLFNWTAGGNDRNSENLLLLDDPEVIKEFQDEFNRLWAYGKERYDN